MKFLKTHIILCSLAFLFAFTSIASAKGGIDCRHGPDKFVLYKNNIPTHCILRTNDSFHGRCLDIAQLWNTLRLNFDEVTNREFSLYKAWDSEYKRWTCEYRAKIIDKFNGSPVNNYYEPHKKKLFSDTYGFLHSLRLFSYYSPETHNFIINKEGFGVDMFCQYATRLYPMESMQYYKIMRPQICPNVDGVCQDKFKGRDNFSRKDTVYPANLYKVWYTDAYTPAACYVPVQVHRRTTHTSHHCIQFETGVKMINEKFSTTPRVQSNQWKHIYAAALLRQYWSHITCYDPKQCGLIGADPPKAHFSNAELPKLIKDLRDALGYEIETTMRTFKFDGEDIRMGLSTLCNIVTEILPFSHEELGKDVKNENLTPCPGQ